MAASMARSCEGLAGASRRARYAWAPCCSIAGRRSVDGVGSGEWAETPATVACSILATQQSDAKHEGHAASSPPLRACPT